MNNAPGDNAPQGPSCAAHDAMSQQSEEISYARQLAERDQQILNLTQQLAERDEQVAKLTGQLKEEQFKRAQDQTETNSRFHAVFKQINDIEAKLQAGEAKWRADMAELRKQYNEIEAMRRQTFRAGISEAMPEKTKKAKKAKKEKKTRGMSADFRRRFRRAFQKEGIKDYIKMRLYPLFGDG